MRIISGTARGAALYAPKGFDTRPTADKVKESFCNIIADDLPGCDFLDLFAGTGAMGLEALSRGAASACFVEQSAAACEAIRWNMEKTRLFDRARLIARPFDSALAMLAAQNVRFGVIFLDPPYGRGLASQALELLAMHRLLADDGLAAAETALTDEVVTPLGLRLYRVREYGAAKISFYTGL